MAYLRAKGRARLMMRLHMPSSKEGSAELQIGFAQSKNISTKGPVEPQVRSGRDDKEGVAFPSHISCWWSELQIPPLRFAPVPRHAGASGMTKERATVP